MKLIGQCGLLSARQTSKPGHCDLTAVKVIWIKGRLVQAALALPGIMVNGFVRKEPPCP